ncbi:MAG: PocR ligand-binding domain-containing protein [Treponema sp.]|nr:PocR ligand-binding domain-containing protein [Treponema sp.]
MENQTTCLYHIFMLEKLGIFYDEEVQRLIDSFAECFRVRFTIFSANHEDMILGFPYDVSPYCKMIRENLHLLSSCLNQNRQMCRRCGRCKDTQYPLVYRCHAGLYESVMPIRVNQQLIGYAMIGQFRACEEEGDIPPELFAQSQKHCIDAEALCAAYQELPLYDKTSMWNMVNLFSVLINFIIMREYINVHQPGQIEKISHWLDKHIAETVELDDVANAIGRCRSTVSHLIKRQFGMSFKQLCALKRVRRFESLIAAEPSLTITEAALRVGYDDPLYFSRIYKKLRLIPPMEYVKSVRNSEADPRMNANCGNYVANTNELDTYQSYSRTSVEKKSITKYMEGVQRGISWEKWIVKAVEHLGKRNGMDFSEAARFIVERELNACGYYREDFEPGVDTGESSATKGARLNETIGPPGPRLADV